MPLPASGPISFNNINVELGVAGTTQASLGQTSYRNLAGVASGQISMSNFYGKANQFAFTISSNQTNANLRTLAIAAGWNQSSKVVATINSGIYISSNSTGTPALTVNGSFPGGVELVNNGYIVGMGGNGGVGDRYSLGGGSAGASGGLALSVSVATTINNASGVIGGGGGGGGGGGWSYLYYRKNNVRERSGSGGGGGRSSAAANSAGGAGGAATYWGGPGNPGSAGTVSSAGAGGAAAGDADARGGVGGAGGGWGSAGSTGGSGTGRGGNGSGFSAGAAGGAVAGNASISWVSTGTRYGGIS